MFDSAPLDLTQWAEPPAYRSAWQQPPLTPKATEARPTLATEFVAYGEMTKQWLSVRDTDVEATPSNSTSTDLAAPGVSQQSVHRALSDRARLLASKYGGGAGREELVRLEILTERLRRLSPRVSQVELNAMTEVVENLEHVAQDRSAMEAEYYRL